MTVRELLALYTRHCTANDVHGSATAADRDRTFRLFNETHGDLPVEDCKSYMLTDWIEANAHRWKSPDTRASNANRIKAAFAWAWKRERIARHPFPNVYFRRGERREEMPDDVLKEVIMLTNTQAGRVFQFLRLTGCRVGELCAANYADVDLDKGLWRIAQHKTRKKTGKARVVALTPDAVDLLKSLPSILPGGQPAKLPSSPLFTNTHGRRWSRHNVHAALAGVKERFGITARVCVHSIRHRFAGAAVANGAPIALVAAQLGNSVQVCERHYVDLSGQIDAVRDAAALSLPEKLIPNRPPVDTDAWRQLIASRKAAETVEADEPAIVVGEPAPSGGPDTPPRAPPRVYRPVKGVGRPFGEAERIAWDGFQLAAKERPDLKTDAAVYEWLVGRPEWANQLPPSSASFRRYLHYARLHLTGMTKRQLRRAGVDPKEGAA